MTALQSSGSRRFLATSLLLSMILFGTTNTHSVAAVSDAEGAIAVNFFWGASSNSEMTWITRDVLITESGDTSYFSIIGNWTPPFYLGVQEIRNAATGEVRKNAIFSAWDTHDDGSCTTCGPESRPTNGRTVMTQVGPGVTPSQFGYEGTGANAFINDFGWKVGDRVKAVVNLRQLADGTEISAALQLNDQPWRFFGTYKYAKKFANLEPGYSFIEDFGRKPMIVRSAEFGNTWMESENLSKRAPINSVQARANTGANTKYHLIKQRNKTTLWAQIGGDQFISEQRYVPAVIDVPLNSYIPIEARLTTLNLEGAAAQSYKTQWLSNKSKLDPVVTPPIKADPTPTPTPTPSIKPAPKKITIMCVKGKVTKKITAIKPKCPSGYKRR
jgi:hypothetical protein